MTMWKTAAAGAAALVIAGSLIVYAQQGPGFEPRGFDRQREAPGVGDWHPTAQDLSAFADARIAALHAGLQLNADQERSWPSFEQALREVAKMRIERMSAARDAQPSDDPIARLQRRADTMTQHGAALKRLADAAAPLYQGLDDAQKRRFAILARFMRPGEDGMMPRDGSGQDGGPGGHGGMGGMRGPGGYHMGPMGPMDPHGFGGGMRNPHGMGGGMGGPRGRDDEDYRGPL
jgi:hypothetical protein